MNFKRWFLFLISVTVMAAPLFAGLKVTPVASLNLLGGQYWMSESMPTSFGANGSLFISPVMNFSPQTALLPIYSGSYRGTKDVRELVGGGTLTQESQDHALSLKFVHKLSPAWRLKARGGYKIEYVKETKDETWGKGLFDYNKIIYGLEGERAGSAMNIRFGADYYTMRYPNYQSLISQSEFETSLDTTTYSEISTAAGKDVLDYAGLSVFGESAVKFSPSTTGVVQYNLLLKNFNDQRVVGNSGEFSSTLRGDMSHGLNFGVTLTTPRVVLSLNDSAQLYTSNQNSFDVANSKYIPNYYNFIQNDVAPSIAFMLGNVERPARLSLSWNISWRSYAERLAQNADASYKDARVMQIINTLGVGFACPLSGSLSAKVAANYSDSASNMRYEKNYKYNYYTINYFTGISWEL